MKQFDIPILFIVFNKPKLTKRVFAKIREAKPIQLFIVADGPRNNKEKVLTDNVRKYIISNINWPCDVKKIFRKTNWGGNRSSVNGLDWFFENVEYGIFLEDDCVPSKSFFKYHRELLLKYKNSSKIKAITGVNFLSNYKMNNSYLFSKTYFSCWGFSTWKRSWGINREDIKKRYKKNLKQMFPNIFHRISVKRHLKLAIEGEIKNWDYLFAAKNTMEEGLVIVPKINLIENIGFKGNSTHTFSKIDKKYLGIKSNKLKFPLKHPCIIENDKRFGNMIGWLLLRKYIEKNSGGIFRKK